MISAVSSAAAALRSTQNTCAPSRAKVTAVALPLPQPGPIEPAPTTIAVLPLSRCIDLSLCLLLTLTRPHDRDIGADRVAKNLRQRPAMSVAAQPPFAGGAGIAEHHVRHRRARTSPLKPAADKTRIRRRLHAGARAFYARLHQLQSLGGNAPVFLPVDLFDGVRPDQREGRDRQR